MYKIIADKKGATLIELLTGMLLFAIIAVAVSAVLVPMISASSEAKGLAENNSLLDRISSEIVSDMKKAYSMKIENNLLTIDTGMYKIVYSVKNGILLKGASADTLSNVHSPGYYKGREVGIEYLDYDKNPISGDIAQPLFVRITLSSDGHVIISRDYAVNPLGIS